MVYLRASGRGCKGLQEELCQLSRCNASRRNGAGAGRQAILDSIWRQEGFDPVVERAHAMPMMAPGSVAATNSVNIMAFLLQKNGVPSGATPLDDTVDLSKVLPSK